jgi:membrane fusion protein (multidrug efflux system)
MNLKIIPAGLAFCLVWGVASAQEAAPPAAVQYIVAQPQPVYAEQNNVGRIQSPQIVRLQARVTGYLESQNFTDGQAVKKGQLLYVIEQPPYQAQVAQAEAAVAQAQAQARNAQLTLARAQALLHTAAGQQSTVDLAQATSLSDSAAVLLAQAQLQTAEINLGYTQILSPVDGVISATSVNVGNVVGPSSGVLATIVSEDPMYVTFALPMVASIRDRPKASQLDVLVQLPDGSMYKQTGKIDFLDNSVTANTDTLSWRGTIPNPNHQLTDGEFITVILRDQQPEQQLVVPLAAIITDQLGTYVLEVGAGNVVVRRNIKLGTPSNTSVPVLSGVSPGDKIITDGIQSIHPGVQVSPQAVAAPAAEQN